MTDLHKEAFPESAGESAEQVEVRRLDDVVPGTSIAPEILMKIDAQGYEDKVLAGAAVTLTKTRAVIVEVSFRELYEGQPLFDSIYHTLKDAGFSYICPLSGDSPRRSQRASGRRVVCEVLKPGVANRTLKSGLQFSFCAGMPKATR